MQVAVSDARENRKSDWILAFDTSAAHCVAALLRGKKVILRDEQMAKGQAERLIPMLQELLAEGGITWADLRAIGVGTGPGNFTGVRIAVAAARGLSLGLGVPAIGVTGFESMALAAPLPVTVLIDARRGEVYAQSFADQGATVPVATPLQDAVIHGGIVGMGGISPRYPLAEAIARIAADRLSVPQRRPAPFYLRAADAAPPSDPPPAMLP